MHLIRCAPIFFALCFHSLAASAHPALIPMPSSLAWQDGNVPISADTVIEGGRGTRPTAAYLSKVLGARQAGHGVSHIRLLLVPRSRIPNPEGYRLHAAGNRVLIEASDQRGLFYGAQTLRQLVVAQSGGARSVAAAEITDSPRFKWRGLLIDLGRHFFGKQTLFKIIDEMAAYKLNVLKLHLTDYEGWRLEIPAYPKLTQVGSLVDGKPQYLTTADVSEIVRYAAERHIMVVPEIEMPSHAGAAARSYPEFFNPDGSAFDPANPKTYDFIQGILTEVARLFPAPYLDFAGDEVGEDSWKGMADVDRLKAEQGLKTTADVEAYFGRKVVAIIESLGKRPMAWDEQVEAHAPKSVIIQWWRRDRPDVLMAAAKAGHDLVISPADELYFDYHQGEGEPGAPWEGNKGGPQSIAKMLAFEPVPDSFTPEQSARVLGIEGCLWTEFIASERYLEFMTFPRLLALAEIAWRQKGPRDEKEFEERLAPHIEALRAKGINARRGEWDAYEYITH
ncbi:MAG TPA: beta-N-acetylhexosaminidase [Sphingomicrobium sp.]|nr:beta-N-acetylhexosaminidase [Sphingomicrobium sp.]